MNDLEIEKRHFEIMNKHGSAMHKELGEMYNYPTCCIKQFCEEQTKGIFSAQYRIMTFKANLPNDIKYVPCDKCFTKMLRKRYVESSNNLSS